MMMNTVCIRQLYPFLPEFHTDFGLDLLLYINASLTLLHWFSVHLNTSSAYIWSEYSLCTGNTVWNLQLQYIYKDLRRHERALRRSVITAAVSASDFSCESSARLNVYSADQLARLPGSYTSSVWTCISWWTNPPGCWQWRQKWVQDWMSSSFPRVNQTLSKTKLDSCIIWLLFPKHQQLQCLGIKFLQW